VPRERFAEHVSGARPPHRFDRKERDPQQPAGGGSRSVETGDQGEIAPRRGNANRALFSVTDRNVPVADEITPGVIDGAALRIAAPRVDRGIIFVTRVAASFVVATGIGGIITPVAYRTSDDRTCREPAKHPGYDRANIPRRSRGRAISSFSSEPNVNPVFMWGSRICLATNASTSSAA
jgi:hypothetical protein